MQQVSGRHSLLSTLALTAFAAVGRAEIRQSVTITNPDFTTNLNGWSKTSGTIWTWASNPSGSGGVAKFSKSGSAATHSMWQYYDLSTSGGVLTAPPSTEFGRKLEFGGWVYVASNFSGKFYLELNSRTSGGVSTNVAKTSPWIDGADVPRNKWLYITTEPVSPYDSRLQSNTAVMSMVCVVNSGTGDLYFDAAKFGVFEYGDLAVADGSFETYDPLLEQQGLPSWTPGGWMVTPGSLSRGSSDDAYYGDNSVEVSVASGTAKVFQALGMGGTNGTPHYHHKMEAGAWFKVDSTAVLTSVKLSLVPSGAGISGASPIASQTLYPADITAGKWTFVQTVPDATSPRIPFKVSSNAVTSLTVQFEMAVTDTTVLELDFVQVGELNGITGNPKAFVVADYYSNYRAPLASDGSYPGWNGVNQWRSWNSTPFSVNADCDNCPEDCSDMQHDPDDYRANSRRDAACSTEDSADNLPLVGAYHPTPA
ncbi:MAG: hypothetical protein HOP15_06650 [Planctomycetes bacterium]|nr:hypothetical protein [Planctomycetota bacterium]